MKNVGEERELISFSSLFTMGKKRERGRREEEIKKRRRIRREKIKEKERRRDGTRVKKGKDFLEDCSKEEAKTVAFERGRAGREGASGWRPRIN